MDSTSGRWPRGWPAVILIAGSKTYITPRNAEIRASAQGRFPAAIVCQTLDEFVVKSTGCEMLAAA
jgi:hypothetical protein